MKRFFFVMLALLLVGVAGIQATPTRVLTMGEADRIMKDDNNIWIWPQAVVMNTDYLIMDVGATGLYRAGMNYNMKGMYFGWYYSSMPYSHPYFPSIPKVGGGASGSIDQKIDLFFGMAPADMPIGVQLSLYGNSYANESTAPSNKTVTSASGLGLRFGTSLMEMVDAYFGFQTYSWTDEGADGKPITEPTGNTTISLGARFWYEAIPDFYTAVPYIGLSFGGMGGKDAANNEENISATSITIGCGDNIMISDGVLAVSDIGIQLNPQSRENVVPNSTTVTTDISTTYLPYLRFGLEAMVSKKVDMRFGAVKEWGKSSTEVSPPGNKQSWGYANTQLYIGTAVHFGNLTFDGWLDPAFFTRGPYLLSGTTGNLAMQVSIKYVWEGRED